MAGVFLYGRVITARAPLAGLRTSWRFGCLLPYAWHQYDCLSAGTRLVDRDGAWVARPAVTCGCTLVVPA